MSNNNSNFPPRNSSEKTFGYLLSIVFLIIALHPLMNKEDIHFSALALSILFIVLVITAPKKLSYLNSLWIKFGEFLGSIFVPIMMAFIFFTIVFPTGLIMRFFHKDLLKQNLDKNIKSYWIVRNEAAGTMKNQY